MFSCISKRYLTNPGQGQILGNSLLENSDISIKAPINMFYPTWKT